MLAFYFNPANLKYAIVLCILLFLLNPTNSSFITLNSIQNNNNIY